MQFQHYKSCTRWRKSNGTTEDTVNNLLGTTQESHK